MKALYTLRGNVLHGKKRGAGLGFPTANIKLASAIPEGIYASKVIIDSTEYEAAAFIGAARTFGEFDSKAEIYVLDFNRDIYGKNISIKLYNKIRENRKFTSEKGLVNQMEKDVEEVKHYFRELNS